MDLNKSRSHRVHGHHGSDALLVGGAYVRGAMAQRVELQPASRMLAKRPSWRPERKIQPMIVEIGLGEKECFRYQSMNKIVNGWV